MVNLKYGDITDKIIGAAVRVHGTLGNGFQEVIYQRALELEFQRILLAHEREFEMPIYYLGIRIGTRRVDFFVIKKISVEMKAVTKLEPVHFAQAINYLEAYNLEIGLLINFGTTKLEVHRLTNKKYNPNKSAYSPDPINPNNPINPSPDIQTSAASQNTRYHA